MSHGGPFMYEMIAGEGEDPRSGSASAMAEDQRDDRAASHDLRPRDLIGYAGNPPDAAWPNDARVAVNFCINYEEGAEYSILNGDNRSESILSEVQTQPRYGERDYDMESLYAYGSKAGFWRILDCFRERGLIGTINAVGQALQLNPAVGAAIRESGFDVVPHGYRWIDYWGMPPEEERRLMRQCVDAVKAVTGMHPLGWYTGRPSANTRRLVVEEGGFLYDSDDYSDDLPFWNTDFGRPHLIVPYAFDTNDSRMQRGGGHETADDFFRYMRDAFDTLYEEGARKPKMMTVGLHCRIIGRPGRIAGLKRLLDHIQSHDRVWVTGRDAIARHWADAHPWDCR